MGIHFVIAEIIGGFVLAMLLAYSYRGMQIYYHLVVELTGIAGLITMIPAVYLYRKDQARREYGRLVPKPAGIDLSAKEVLWLLVMGAGLALFANMILNILQIFLQSTVYEDEMELITSGKSVWLLVFWMGIVAPIAEEMVFRWLMYLRLRDYMRVGAAALISGVIFGIYHGNLVQAIYASILGVAFAYILEMSGNLWSSVLLHIGANTASLLLEEYAVQIQKYLGDIGILAAYLLLLIAVITGIRYFKVKGKERGYRAV
jgi:hypothetical protein